MKKQLLAAGCILFSVISPLKAMAADLSSFSQLFVFGDSLSDTGNTFTFTGGQIPAPTVSGSDRLAYFPGRFSNGSNWVDYFGSQIGKQGLTPIPLVPLLVNPNPRIASQQGVNFALGGAQTGKSSDFPGLQNNIPGVLGQVGLFSSFNQTFPADPNALYTIFGGGNDYFSGQTDVNQVVQNLSNSISSLAQGNAKNFLVFNQPDLGESPFGRALGFPQQLNELTKEHNKLLALSLDNLRTIRPDINIFSVDTNALFKTVEFDPVKFGFKDATNSCITGNFQQVLSICDNPDDFVFFDNVHLSSRANRLLADAALASVRGQSIPEPSAALGILALGALGLGVLKRKQKKSELIPAGRAVALQSSHTGVES
ncbi:MAG: SGNH/GDSL hydrolase family protein [Cyanomargarita calcarea GSE-NOS-MK-12-04C]|jgi:phospholipase/lecithinase/hemolysin|uniref:SGNH/GDSL hydrolase family protein n=1 Tax=Cyanomargarita calcarea GSE-NOS-MK-12-04C TaxID=2839659 RepID=A0A951QIA9_9CYAN|nr:SGNH/GDSL hydrolase family protein [Cyanomargarita calcarea GSE-NOS-MK-12-04C]